MQSLLFPPESHERVDLGRGEIAIQFRTVRLRLLYGRFFCHCFLRFDRNGSMGRFRSLLFGLGFSLGTALFAALGGCGRAAEEDRKKEGAGEDLSHDGIRNSG